MAGLQPIHASRSPPGPLRSPKYLQISTIRLPSILVFTPQWIWGGSYCPAAPPTGTHTVSDHGNPESQKMPFHAGLFLFTLHLPINLSHPDATQMIRIRGTNTADIILTWVTLMFSTRYLCFSFFLFMFTVSTLIPPTRMDRCMLSVLISLLLKCDRTPNELCRLILSFPNCTQPLTR